MEQTLNWKQIEKSKDPKIIKIKENLEKKLDKHIGNDEKTKKAFKNCFHITIETWPRRRRERKNAST